MEGEGLPFPILQDPERSIAQAYGMSKTGDDRYLANSSEGRRPGVIIDEGGLVLMLLPDLATVEGALQKRAILYDKAGDMHYDTISAFIKSVRGSSPDAALYWLARMLEAGEDPRFVARRIVICASEDVGNAAPYALVIANAALQVAEFVGMPEARIPLAQAVTYIATCPKSNSAITGIDRAIEAVQSGRLLEVPEHLKDANYPGAKKLGRGEGYQYSHNFEGHFVAQDYIPEDLIFYEPSDQGHEKEIRQRLDEWRRLKKQDG